MSETLCEVCEANTSKYKCPHCQLRYCSVSCFKSHIQEHESSSDSPTKSSPTTEPANPPTEQEQEEQEQENEDEPEEPEEPSHPQSPYVTLQSHPQFTSLFTRYPSLRAQLNRVYTATKNPAISVNELVEEAKTNGHGRKPYGRDRVKGQWTQEKGNQLARGIMVQLMEDEEGVREFMALVGSVFRPGKREREGDVGIGAEMDGL